MKVVAILTNECITLEKPHITQLDKKLNNNNVQPKQIKIQQTNYYFDKNGWW